MVGRVLVHEPLFARHVSQEHPAGAAAQRSSHGAELRLPAIGRPEVPGEDFDKIPGIAAIAAETGEIELVQDHGVERDQLLAPRPIQRKAWQLGEIGGLELRRDRVQASQRASIVVLVVALDQLGREALEQPRSAVQRFPSASALSSSLL